ncbi:MAG: hypothetical protein H8D56_06690 [Planctomycetes bacterium]|nr:hypothetical protein [Planctomycetota bacterium]MBL7143948.1 hypothetical protein [Phycisphaerae bacterium]
MKRVMQIKVMLLLLFATCGLAGINRVPSDYPTIQVAIDASMDGDTVLIAPGTYTGDGNRDIDFKCKAITVKSEQGPQTCIVDCQGSEDEPHRGFFFHSYEDANSVVQGFTIINGYASRGGGIFCQNASPHILDCLITENTALEGGGVKCHYSNPTITRCIIRNNSSNYGGGVGIGITGDTSSLLTMTNCFITGNKAKRSGGGIYCIGKVNLLNCTVFGNSAGVEGGGISFFLVVGERIKNSILYGNMSSTGSEIAIVTPLPGAGGGGYRPLFQITHSIVGSDPNAIYFTFFDGYIYGEWLYADPLFANPGYWDPNGTSDDPNDDFWVEGDYHLKSQAGRWDPNSESWVQDDITSPCIDSGDPNSPIGHEPFPNGGIVNMGAYGGTAEASKSYFGKPVCETIIAGDINGDCRVDIKDLAIMIAHWLEDNTP